MVNEYRARISYLRKSEMKVHALAQEKLPSRKNVEPASRPLDLSRLGLSDIYACFGKKLGILRADEKYTKLILFSSYTVHYTLSDEPCSCVWVGFLCSFIFFSSFILSIGSMMDIGVLLVLYRELLLG
jgi:hypothetical protein